MTVALNHTPLLAIQFPEATESGRPSLLTVPLDSIVYVRSTRTALTLCLRTGACLTVRADAPAAVCQLLGLQAPPPME